MSTHPPRVTADDWALLASMRRDLDRIQASIARRRARLVRMGVL